MFEVMFLEQASSLERFDFLLEICKKKKTQTLSASPFVYLLVFSAFGIIFASSRYITLKLSPQN